MLRLLIISSLVMLTACRGEPKPKQDPTVIASVNTEGITRPQYERPPPR